MIVLRQKNEFDIKDLNNKIVIEISPVISNYNKTKSLSMNL